MTDEDKTLLELAAKAAGYGLPSSDDHDEIGRQYEYHLGLWVKHPWGWGWFRPHIDDGDALKLAVKLGLTIVIESDMVFCRNQRSDKAFCESGSDLYSAVRRAIVRAAADVGKVMK